MQEDTLNAAFSDVAEDPAVVQPPMDVETQRDLWAQLWLDSQTFAGKVNAKLVAKLHAHGFSLKSHPHPGLRTGASLQFTCWNVKSVWAHPDCAVPFLAEVALSVLWPDESMGEVQLTIDLFDENEVSQVPGVIGFEEMLSTHWDVAPATAELAQMPTGEAQRDAWLAHMTQRVDAWPEATVDAVVADVVNLLERWLTP